MAFVFVWCLLIFWLWWWAIGGIYSCLYSLSTSQCLVYNAMNNFWDLWSELDRSFPSLISFRLDWDILSQLLSNTSNPSKRNTSLLSPLLLNASAHKQWNASNLWQSSRGLKLLFNSFDFSPNGAAGKPFLSVNIEISGNYVSSGRAFVRRSRLWTGYDGIARGRKAGEVRAGYSVAYLQDTNSHEVYQTANISTKGPTGEMLSWSKA